MKLLEKTNQSRLRKQHMKLPSIRSSWSLSTWPVSPFLPRCPVLLRRKVKRLVTSPTQHIRKQASALPASMAVSVNSSRPPNHLSFLFLTYWRHHCVLRTLPPWDLIPYFTFFHSLCLQYQFKVCKLLFSASATHPSLPLSPVNPDLLGTGSINLIGTLRRTHCVGGSL